MAAETRSFAKQLGLKPVTTPVTSPQSNGMAESFVKTFKRDHVKLADRLDSETVMAQLPKWFDDLIVITCKAVWLSATQAVQGKNEGQIKNTDSCLTLTILTARRQLSWPVEAVDEFNPLLAWADLSHRCGYGLR